MFRGGTNHSKSEVHVIHWCESPHFDSDYVYYAELHALFFSLCAYDLGDPAYSVWVGLLPEVAMFRTPSICIVVNLGNQQNAARKLAIPSAVNPTNWLHFKKESLITYRTHDLVSSEHLMKGMQP